MNHISASYRQFLQTHFDDQELVQFCFDYFRDVHGDFTQGMRKSQKVQVLLEHCEKQNQWKNLDAALQVKRSKAYNIQFPDKPQLDIRPRHYKPVQRNPRKVFISHAISYAPRDVEFAHRLAHDLRIRGWQTWIAPDDIPPGVEWQKAIDQGLEESGILVLVLTPKAAVSSYVEDETYTAIRLDKAGKMRFLPLLVEDCEMPPSWSAYQYISFQGDYKASLQVLFEQLQPEPMEHLAQLYGQLELAIKEKEWEQARNLGGQIEAQYPDYQDAARLLAQAVEGQKQQEERKQKLANLYHQMQKAIEKGEWIAAKTAGQQIKDVDRNYRDITQLLTQVNESLRQQKREAKRAQIRRLQVTITDFIRRIPTGAWFAILGVPLVIGLIFVFRGFELGNPNELYTPNATVSPLATSVSAILPTATDVGISNIPTPSPINTPTLKPLTKTPTTMPSVTNTPTSTNTPTITNTPTPTLDPNVPPPNAALHDTWLRPADKMIMVYVPEGTFMMGSTDADIDAALALCNQLYEKSGTGTCERSWFEDEYPQHTITVSDFWIDQTEVTNAQYTLCVMAGECQASLHGDDISLNGESYPVVGVSWNDAHDYCQWAEAQLPTEAEWEYAARGEDGNIYPWGNEFDGTKANYCDSNCTFGWKDNSQNDGYVITSPVGNYSPDGDSWIGASDMAGNVWEWTADWYDRNYFENSPEKNPTGPESSDYKVSHGGGWFNTPSNLRSSFRDSLVPDIRLNSLGFRCAVIPDN